MQISGRILDSGLLRGHRTPVILQTEAAECGIACLAMIAGHYGHRLDIAVLRRQYSLSLKGMTLHDIVRLASTMRLSTRALRTDLPHLASLKLPAILHWDHNHFVVLTKADARGVTIHDPAIGRRRIPIAELDRRFTGVALEAWPAQGFERKTERARINVWDMLRQAEGFWAAASRILAMSLVLEAIVIALPIGFQLVLDDVLVADDRNLLTLIACGLGLLLGFRTVTELVRSWAIMAAGSGLSLQWKMSLFRYLLRLPLGFFERRHVGDVASRFVSIDMLQKTLSTSSISGVVDGVMALALVAMMWLYDPLLAVLAVVSTAAYAGTRAIAYRFYRVANEQAIICAAQENSHFIESLRGMPSIKALALGDRRQGIWNNLLVDRVNADLRVQKIDLVFTAINGLLFGVDRILIIVLGARAVMAGGLTVGMLVAFLAYKDQFSQRVGQCLDTLVKLGTLAVHGERIADIALAEPEQDDAASGRLAAPFVMARRVSLSARGIGFRYGDNEPPVVSGFDLEVRPGECVAIAGPSGAGKTTVLKMLAGLLPPTSGTVLIDGMPLSAIGLEAYRAQIGCVLQDDRLFAGSIAENIASFAPAADPERVQTAATLASVHTEILRMPMGYETLVGDMGSSLSGGQAQRLVLARALFRAPRILLLDEATSHLDEENERRINHAIRQLPISRIIVAHRRSTLEMADRIVPVWPAAVTPAGRNDIERRG